MKKTWPFVAAVAVVGGLSGAALAGRPSAKDDFKIDPSSITQRDSSPTTVPQP